MADLFRQTAEHLALHDDHRAFGKRCLSVIRRLEILAEGKSESALIRNTTHPRYTKLPGLVSTAKQERMDLEARMNELVKRFDPARFVCCAPKVPMVEAVHKLNLPSVRLSYTEGGKLIVGGSVVPVVWGRGNGSAVVRSKTLSTLANGAVDCVSLECQLAKWLAWNGPDALTVPRPKAKKYKYFGVRRSG